MKLDRTDLSEHLYWDFRMKLTTCLVTQLGTKITINLLTDFSNPQGFNVNSFAKVLSPNFSVKTEQ